MVRNIHLIKKKDEDSKNLIKGALKVFNNVQIFSVNIVVESKKFMLTSSCQLLVGYLLQLKNLKEELKDISVEFDGKVVDVIKVRLTSYFYSILKNY